MFRPVIEYLSSLSSRFGEGWTRFWFTPVDVIAVCVLRIVVGAAALYFVASFTSELTRWFGEGGLLPQEAVANIAGGRPGQPSYRLSFFHFAETPAGLWVLHALSLAATAAFMLGLFSRVTSFLSLAAVLSYIHRAPIVAGPFEPVLCFMLAYLCLAPTGVYLSLDRRLKLNKTADRVNPATGLPVDAVRSWTAGTALRLMQVHLSALYFMTGLWMLAGSSWWDGEAIWIMMAQTRTRLIDWSFIREAGYVVNFLTHAIVIFHLAFGVLIWSRWARPLLLAISVLAWIFIGLVSTQVAYAALMLFAGLAFVAPEMLRRWFGGRGRTLSARSAATVAARSEPVAAK
jgi:hypothetical protein